MAKDWGPDGITANAICPGFFPTELTQPVVDDAKRWQNNADRTFLGRNGVTEDMHGALIMLCSEAGRYMSGQMIYVDAGFTAN
jgi:gluconate 5-dehydrogenase